MSSDRPYGACTKVSLRRWLLAAYLGGATAALGFALADAQPSQNPDAAPPICKEQHSKPAHDHDTDHDSAEEHDHDADHDADAAPLGAFVAGDALVAVEPLVDVDGSLAFAVTAQAPDGQPVPVTLTATAPDGRQFDVRATGELTLVPAGSVMDGVWSFRGAVGEAELEAKMLFLRGRTDLGTEVVAVLTPAPEQPTTSTLYFYAVADGENIHSRFTAELVHHGSHAGEATDLAHSHFTPEHSALGFDPMANTTILNFDAPGDWELHVTIHSGLGETAVFPIEVRE